MYFQWKPYVSVAQRRANAAKDMKARAKKGLKVDPVVIEGRKIATTFWGKSWCEAMESDADFENRLPRGRTYARNGSVVHLEVSAGTVTAVVSGSALYDVTVRVKALPDARWRAIRSACGAGVSALALLQGKLDDAVMSVLTAPGAGMIPEGGDFKISCSCPDYATLCKHAAAVLYGVGARLDRDPALLFTLRGVNMNELVAAASGGLGKGTSKRSLAADDAELADIFGIELDAPTSPAATPNKATPKKATPKKATPEQAVSAAAVPAGLYDAAQLRAMGYTPAKVKRLLDEGALTRVSFGWYRFLKAP